MIIGQVMWGVYMDLQLTEMYSYETNKDYAYRMIHENIMEMVLPPDSIISEKDLAKSLNLSRTPIREILFRLQNQNLIEVTPQGSRVTLIDESLINEALDMRLALEQQVILYLQKHIAAEYMEELEHTIDLQEFYLEKGRTAKSYEQDRTFHLQVYKFAGRERTWEIIKDFSTHFDRVRRLKNKYDSPEDLAALLGHHREYLRVIRDKASAAEVAGLLEAHMIHSYRNWFQAFRGSENWRNFSPFFKNVGVE